MDSKKLRQTLELGEFVDIIDRYAKEERRSRASMVKQLIAEALKVRREKEEKEKIG
jgi:hypothetical protein